jgi:hypothetical protein
MLRICSSEEVTDSLDVACARASRAHSVLLAVTCAAACDTAVEVSRSF